MVCNISFSGDITPVSSSSAHRGCRVCLPVAQLQGAVLTADPKRKQRSTGSLNMGEKSGVKNREK